MGARVYGVGARVYGAGARVYGVGARVYGSLVIIESAPVQRIGFLIFKTWSGLLGPDLGTIGTGDWDLDLGLTMMMMTINVCPPQALVSLRAGDDDGVVTSNVTCVTRDMRQVTRPRGHVTRALEPGDTWACVTCVDTWLHWLQPHNWLDTSWPAAR